MTNSRARIASSALLTATAVSLAVLLGACSSSTPTAAPSTGAVVHPRPAHSRSAAGFNSCSIVEQSDVSTALGESVRAGVIGKATVEGGLACVFYGPSVAVGTDPDIPVPNSVRVVLVQGVKGPVWFNDYKSKVPAVSLSGLGDQAYYDGSASVSVLKGNAYLRISVIKATGTDEAAEQTLAATCIPRM